MGDETPRGLAGYVVMGLKSARHRMDLHYHHCAMQQEDVLDPRLPLTNAEAHVKRLITALESEPDEVTAADMPSSWTAATDCEGLLWLKRPNRRNRWTTEGERGAMMEGPELLYEYGPMKRAVDPRG